MSRLLGSEERAMRRDLTAYLGREVRVSVDRPLGSRLRRHADLRYPINYGCLPTTTSGDGEPIDAYVIGCDEPVAEAYGVVVAVVLRADDDEDKLVVAADGRRRSAEEIAGPIAFQERFFASRVVVAEDTSDTSSDSAAGKAESEAERGPA